MSSLSKYRLFVFIFFATLTFQIVGMATGLFGHDAHYDKIVHFLVPASGAPLLYMLLMRWGILRPLPAIGMIVTIVLLGIAAEAVWEVFEFALDKVMQKNWQYGLSGTILDIIAAAAGSLTGALVFTDRYKESNR